MRSMTGFGGGSAMLPDSEFGFKVELTSVNRKQLEIRVSMPNELASGEPVIRAIISEKISRGAINVRVTMNDAGNPLSHLKINRPLLNELVTQLRKIQQENGIDEKVEIQQLMLIPGVVQSFTSSAIPAEIENLLREATTLALQNLIAMREAEGAALRHEFKSRIAHLENLINQLEPLVSGLPEQMYEKLLTRLKNSGLDVDYNDERVLKELVIFSDKADVSEELNRMKSHFAQFRKFLDGSGNNGRSMDFLAQEMFREINTLGNKASCCESTPILVEFKSELEKIREQLQNIE
ncbi:MAG: YicC family protein [Lentisphaerae bacterium]|nr:YicC family protein [Lentisphaerota bacterium]